MRAIVLVVFCSMVLMVMAQEKSASSAPPAWMNGSVSKMQSALTAKYPAQQARIERGLEQVAEFWRDEDGDAGVFESFVQANFAGDQATLDTMFNRYEGLMEQLQGHMHEIGREFRQQSDLDIGPILWRMTQPAGRYKPSPGPFGCAQGRL